MKKNQGITLIALIITVIVMLVLVAVSVSILVESDLIGTAEKTGDKYKAEQQKEQTLGQITIGNKTYASINDYMNKNPITEEPEEVETLVTPTVELSENILTVTAVENATSYEVYEKISDEYTLIATLTTNLTLDLSTLEIEAGDHVFVVKAKAEGYTDSAYSNEVTYTKIVVVGTPSADNLFGVWVFNDTITYSPYNSYEEIKVSFTSNNNEYSRIAVYGNSAGFYYLRYLTGYHTGDSVYGYSTNKWTNVTYKTIDFGSTGQEVSDKFYTWLTANATKQQ